MVMKEDKPNSKTSRHPDAPKMADPQAVKKFLDRAKRLLIPSPERLLAMPTSKTVH
jgi:hypothetical protein